MFTEERQKHIGYTRRLLQVMVSGAVLSVVVYIPLYFQGSRAWQTFAILGFLIAMLVCMALAFRAIRRERLERAGGWLMAGVALAYGGLELLFAGATREVTLSSVLLIILISSITLPRRWPAWALPVALMLIYIGVVNVFPLVPRYDIGQTYGPNFILAVALFVVLGVVWQLVRLGGQVSSLRKTVTNLQETDGILRRQLDELTILHAIAIAGTEATSKDGFLERAAQLIGLTLYPHNFGILLLNPATQMLHLHAAYHLHDDYQTTPDPIPLGRSLPGLVAQDGRARCLAAVPEDEADDARPLHADARSALCVPLKIEGKIIGVLNVESEQSEAFTEADERLLTTLAGQLATTVDRLASAESVRQQAQQLTTLYDVGRHITSILSLEELLPEIGRLIATTLAFYNVEIALLEGDALVFQAGYGGYRKGGFVPGDSLVVGEGITGQAVAQGRTVLVPDVRRSPHYVGHPSLPETRSEIAVPLQASGEIIGVLSVKSAQVHGLDEAHAAMLESLAAQVAVAVQNARLFATLNQQQRELRGVYEVALSTSGVLEPDALFRQLYRQIKRMMDPDGFTVVLYDEASGTVKPALRVQNGVSEEDLGTSPMLDSGLIGRVIQTRRPYLIEDIEDTAVFLPPRVDKQMRTWFGVPLIARNRPIGALAVRSFRVNAFSQVQQRFLESIAGQVAVSVDNARLYHNAVQAAERFSILHWASQEIIKASIEPERIYAAIHQATAKLMVAEAFVIALLGEHEDAIHLVYLVDQDRHYTHAPIAREQGLSGHVITSGEALHVDDLEQVDDLDVRHFGCSKSVRSFLAVPLQRGGHTFGMISAQSYRPDAYSQEDLHLLELLGAHAAIALDNARLFKAERERRTELETLRQASLHLTSQLALQPVLREILQTALNLVPAKDAHFFLYDGESLSFGAAHWRDRQERPPFKQLRDHGLTYTVARSGQRLVIPDMSSHPMYADQEKEGAIVGLPLCIGSRVVGVMNVAFAQPHTFSDHELRTLELLADQAVIAVRNAKLFEADQRQLQELSVLHAVALAGAETTDEDDLIERATELIGNTLYPDNFGVMLLHEDTGSLRFHKSYRGIDAEARDISIPLGKGITGQVALSGKPLRVPCQSEAANCIILNPTMRSELCLPLKVGEEIIGVVNAESTQEASFTVEDERLMATFAGQLATAIEKARLFTELSENFAREKRLNEIARIISGELELSEILHQVVRLAAELVRADAGVLSLVGEGEEEGEAQPYVFNMPVDVTQRILPRNQGIAWHIIESGESLLLSRYGDHPRAMPELVKAGLLGFIGVPVPIGGQVIGALGLFSTHADQRFTSRDLALAEAIGLQTGIAVQNARLFAQAQERTTDLTQALDQLKELDHLKNEFIQNVSHELRMPLGIVRGYVELLSMGKLGEIQPEQRQPLKIIVRRVEMVSRIVEDLTAILEVEAQHLQRERVDIVGLVQASWVDFQVSAQNAGVTLTSEIDPTTAPVMGDSLKLRRVLDNLIGNALKFTPAEGSITVRLWDLDQDVILEVQDTGIGISESQIEHIFERFYQIDGSTKRRYGGTGLGLALVKEIVEAHDGTVAVRSTPGEGSTFRVTFPKSD